MVGTSAVTNWANDMPPSAKSIETDVTLFHPFLIEQKPKYKTALSCRTTYSIPAFSSTSAVMVSSTFGIFIGKHSCSIINQKTHVIFEIAFFHNHFLHPMEKDYGIQKGRILAYHAVGKIHPPTTR